MSWATAQPFARAGGGSKNVRRPITVGCGGRTRPRMRVVIRGDEIGIDWIQIGGACLVQLGTGEHAGMLRISRGTGFHFSRPGGAKARGSTVCLLLEMPPGSSLERRDQVPCAYSIEDGAIVLSLPSWPKSPDSDRAPAMVGRAAPTPTRPAASASERRAPFGIGGPDLADIHAAKTGRPR